jgi:hypothetical protein
MSGLTAASDPTPKSMSGLTAASDRLCKSSGGLREPRIDFGSPLEAYVSLGSTLETLPSIDDWLAAVDGREGEHSLPLQGLAGAASERKVRLGLEPRYCSSLTYHLPQVYADVIAVR